MIVEGKAQNEGYGITLTASLLKSDFVELLTKTKAFEPFEIEVEVL
jgi:hypothetical protein